MPPAQLFRALSDATRLRILLLLRGREICVGDLMAALQVPQAKVSRHLTYLRRAGLVAARKDGLWVHYSLVRPTTALQQRVLRSLDSCAELLPEAAADERRFAAALKAGGCCPA